MLGVAVSPAMTATRKGTGCVGSSADVATAVLVKITITKSRHAWVASEVALNTIHYVFATIGEASNNCSFSATRWVLTHLGLSLAKTWMIALMVHGTQW